jgi:methanogenic corrinoid protein MtbC1
MESALVLPAGHQLRDQAPRLADAVVACAFRRHPLLAARHGPGGRAVLREQALGHVKQLADAVGQDSAALFLDHVGWAKVLMAHRDADDEELVHHLACLAEALREQMPAPVADGAVAVVQAALAALPAMPQTLPSVIDPAQPMAALAEYYLHTLLGGDRGAAARAVLAAAERGEPLRALYLQVLQPALREVGRLWQTARVNVAQEHFCSAATQVLMSHLMALAPAAEPRGRRVVVACVGGVGHEVGARMVSDFFELAGWDSILCGADTPQADLLALVAERAPQVLALSASMGCHLHTLQALVEAARADPRCPGLRMLVGGHPFTVDPDLWRTVGADGTAADAAGAVEAALAAVH